MQNADRMPLCYSKLIHTKQNQSHLFIRYAQFFPFILYLLSEIVFYGVQKLNGNRVFRKIEIIHVRHIVSSVAQKQNSVDFSNSSCKLTMLSKASQLQIQNRKSSGNARIYTFKLGLQVFLNFFPRV